MNDMSAENFIERPEVRYTQVPNELIQDFPKFNSMGVDGLRAQSLLFIIYSKPPTWKFYRKSLADEMGLTHRTFDRVVKAAKDSGWLEIDLIGHSPYTGKASYRWVIKIPTSMAAENVSPATGDDPLPETGDDPSPTVGEHSKTISSKTNLGRLNKEFSPSVKIPESGKGRKTLGHLLGNVWGLGSITEAGLDHEERLGIEARLEEMPLQGVEEALRGLYRLGYTPEEAFRRVL